MTAEDKKGDARQSGARSGSHIDDESTQLVLLERDDFVVARLLRQLEQGARRCQPQPRHVWLAVATKEDD